MNKAIFQKKIYRHYRLTKRSLPWRRTTDPYRIFISEVMLQQTQASRVIPKYREFLKKFPTVAILARASMSEVLFIWQGLGYNRRALLLRRAAEVIMKEHNGKFPDAYEDLISLPSIGSYTANAIMVFAYDAPMVMIETNIRTVFIHFFFPTMKKVADKELLPLIEEYMDHIRPREWYNALMDYGVYLKETIPNPSRRSKHHTKQTSFKGSLRQVRGFIIKMYAENPKITKQALIKKAPYEKGKVDQAYEALKKEGFFIN